MTRSILLTGPVHAFERWRAPLEAAGWRVEVLALVETIAQPFERPTTSPDRIVFTSLSAVRFFGAARELGDVPCSVVGEATAAAARAAGYRVEHVSSGTAERLAAEIADQFEPGSILWPRGDLARELGDLLRVAGWIVEAPIVYRTVAAEARRPPPTDAVFFASPSAVRSWTERWPADRRAIAIGVTTARALQEEGWTSSCTLASPSPQHLPRALEGGKDRSKGL